MPKPKKVSQALKIKSVCVKRNGIWEKLKNGADYITEKDSKGNITAISLLLSKPNK